MYACKVVKAEIGLNVSRRIPHITCQANHFNWNEIFSDSHLNNTSSYWSKKYISKNDKLQLHAQGLEGILFWGSVL